jgi:sugar lactone lactonase YvrE
LDWKSKQHQVYALGVQVGCLGFRQEGGLVLATAEGFCTWSVQEGLKPILDPRSPNEGRFNDGAVDREGRFWAGTMTPEGFGNHLHRLEPKGSVDRMENGVGIANGMGWSPEGDTFYFTDSPRKTIYAYDFDAAKGRIFNRRVWVHTPDDLGVPDGLTVDAQGCVWSVRWDGWKIERYDPAGNLLEEIKVPCQRPTSCAFAGDELSTLVITSARDGLEDAQLEQQPLAGDLFYYESGTTGLKESFFKG